MQKHIRLVVMFAVALSCHSVCRAQNAEFPQPTLLGIYPAGGKTGSSFEVKITDATLIDEASNLVFSHPGITAKPVMTEPDRFFPEPRPVPNSFEVTIKPDTPSGIYEVRAQIGTLVTNARRFVVGVLTESVETEPNDSFDTANEIAANTTTNGQFGTDYDYFRFSAEKGQRLLIECLAHRIDSRGDPVLFLFDEQGRLLRRNHDAIGLDSMLDFTVPENGTYVVRVHDLVFATGGTANKSPYRLSIAQRPWIDFIEPPVALRGQSGQFKLFGRNLGGESTEIVRDGQKLEMKTVTIQAPSTGDQESGRASLFVPVYNATQESFVFRHTQNGQVSNPICIPLADDAAISEVEPNDSVSDAQKVSGDVELFGRFDRAGDIDSFVIDAKAGDRFWIELGSQRLGEPTDPVLIIQQLTPQEGAPDRVQDRLTVDDPPQIGNFRLNLVHSDPATLFEAPADGRFRIMVRDQFNVAGTGYVARYRLRIRSPQPSFRLVALPDGRLSPNTNNNRQLKPRNAVVGLGGATEIIVVAYRQEGFDGEIEISAEGVPRGVTVAPAIIGPKQDYSAVLVHASTDAPVWRGLIQLTGRATVGGRKISVPVSCMEVLWPTVNNTNTVARLSAGVPLSVCDEPISATLQATAAEFRMARGGKIPVSFKLAKQGELKGNATVSVIGLPNRVTRGTANATPDGKEAKIDLDVQTDVPPGRYTFFLRGEVDYQYRRRIDLEERAKKDKDRITALAKQLGDEYQKSTKARQVAEQMFQQTTQKRGTANTAKTQADSLVRQDQQKLTSSKQSHDRLKTEFTKAEQQLASATQQRDKADEAAKAAADTAFQQANTKLQQAQAAFKTAEMQLKAAEIKFEETTKKQAAAETARVAAEADLATATAARAKTMSDEAQAKKTRELADQRKREIDTIARTAENNARAKTIKIPIYSPQLTLEVADFPTQLKFPKDAITVVAGSKSPILVTCQREFGFDGDVSFAIQPPSGVSGWSATNNPKIPKGKNDVTFDLQVSANTKPGDFAAEWIVRLQMNGRSLEKRVPVQVKVTAPTPKE